MKQLSIYLPTFSSDYSGVCSALFDLNCLVVINDAQGCTGNYINCDEPRWTVKKKSILCSQLRTMDAVLGNDEKVILQVVEAAEKLHADFIAVLGSPVPAIIGMDMTGMAREIEARSGRPALGFNTTGFSYYNKGVSDAFMMLLKRFTAPAGMTIANSVNILGLTPLDFSANNNSKLFRKLLEEHGFKINASLLMESDLEQVRRAAGAAVNLVVSQTGWAAAQYMRAQFGIPYIVAVPLGQRYSQSIIQMLRQTELDKVSRIITGGPSTQKAVSSMLVVGEQVMANSLRAALWQAGSCRRITVASFFALEPALALPEDILLKDEGHLIKMLRSGKYDSMLADPLIAGIPAAKTLKCHVLPHPAVSGYLYWNQMPLLVGAEMENLLQSLSNKKS